MAKKEAEAPEGGDAPKKKGKLMLFIIIGVVVLALVAGGAAFMLMKKSPSDEDEEDAGPKSSKTAKKDKKEKKNAPPAYYKMDKPFTVKLQAEGAENYLQVEVQLKLLDALLIEQIKVFDPEIKHKVTLLLLGQKVADLNTVQGVQKLSNNIRNTINDIMDPPDPRKKKAPAEDDADPDSPVQAVLFTSFIVQ
jgi:flagellar FliL protein